MSRGWLVVFAKAPRPGLVKTRLCPPYSLEESAALYKEMLADILIATRRYAEALDLEPIVAFHPPDAIFELLDGSPPDFRFQAQRGTGLGHRMAHAVREAIAAGAGMILIRGSDSPAMPFACFEEAVAALEGGSDVVLTPDQGGGYALIGMRETETRLFEPTMSTESVLDQTIAVARDLGLSAATTRASFDIDTVGDLQLLDGLTSGEKTDLCPKTVQYLSTAPVRHVL